MDLVRGKMGPQELQSALLGLMASQRGLPVPRETKDPAWRLESSLPARLPIPSPWPLRLLGDVHERMVAARGEQGRTQRKKAGSFYTPQHVIRYIVTRTILPSLSVRLSRVRAHRGRLVDAVLEKLTQFRVGDPAMGAGFFLLEALEVMVSVAATALRRGGMRVDQGLLSLLRGKVATACLHGVELDCEARDLARDSLWLAAADPRLSRRELDAHLIRGEGLCEGALDEAALQAVVGNPPYGARLASRAVRSAGGRLRTVSSGYRNSALMFLERSMELLGPGGRMGLILPKSLAYSRGWWTGARLLLPGLLQVLDASLAFEGVRLEQVVIIARKGRARSGTYATGRLQHASPIWSGRVPRQVCARASCLLVDASPNEVETFGRIQGACRTFGDVSESFRGAGLQARRVTRGGIPAVEGRSVQRWHVSGRPGRYSTGSLGKNRFARIRTAPKILSQNIVAHIQRPQPHIRLTSCMDLHGVLTLDTVTNTVVTDPEVDPFLVLAVLNSRFMSWWAYRFVFCGAVRTMHLDAQYIGRLPLPRASTHTALQREAAVLAGRLTRRGGSRDLVVKLEGVVNALYGVEPLDDGFCLASSRG